MFKNQAKNIKTESVDDFLARGGKINKIVEGDTCKRITRKTTPANSNLSIDDAKVLLERAYQTGKEEAVIAYLKTQGYVIRR